MSNKERIIRLGFDYGSFLGAVDQGIIKESRLEEDDATLTGYLKRILEQPGLLTSHPPL
jgi:hypothetical protein